jgi:hypothetical protein
MAYPPLAQRFDRAMDQRDPGDLRLDRREAIRDRREFGAQFGAHRFEREFGHSLRGPLRPSSAHMSHALRIVQELRRRPRKAV